MLPLVLTSNERAVKAMGAAWKRLQRPAYPAAVLTLAHWAFIHNGIAAGLVNFAPLILLQIVRLALVIRRSFKRDNREKYQ